MEEKNCPKTVAGGDTSTVAFDGDGMSCQYRCPESKKRVFLIAIAFLSCFWLYSATFFYPTLRHVLRSYSYPHQHHHDHHHDGHKDSSLTVHTGDVFVIEWEPERDVKHSRISLYLHCVKTNTIVVPIAVNVKDTGNHPWAMPIDLKEGDDAYAIQFVRHRGCGRRKNRAPKLFYSQTFSVTQRNRRRGLLPRQDDASTEQPSGVEAPTEADQAATDVPTPPVDTNTQAPPPVDTNTQAPPPDEPTPEPVPPPTEPVPPPATETPPETESQPQPTTPAEPESTPGESTPSSSSPPSDTGSGSGPASTTDEPLTTDEPPPPPSESSSTSTEFSQVIETIQVTITTTAENGQPTVAVIQSTATSEIPVNTVVSSASTGGGKSSSNIGPIVGGVVGGIVALAAIAFGIWFFMRKRRRDKQRRYGANDTPDYDHGVGIGAGGGGKPSPPISPYPDKSPTLPNLTPIPAPPPPRRLRPDQPAPGQGLAPHNPQDPGHLSDESQMLPISELPADQEPAEMYAGPLPDDNKAGTAMGPGGAGVMYHELNDHHNQPAPQYSAYVNGGNVSQHPTNPYFAPGAGGAPGEGYRGVPRYPDNPNSYGTPAYGGGGGGGSYQDRARAAYHDRGQSLTSNVSAPSAHSPVSPGPAAGGGGGGLQHSASVASHGSGVSGVSGISGYQERLDAGGNVDDHGHPQPPQ